MKRSILLALVAALALAVGISASASAADGAQATAKKKAAKCNSKPKAKKKAGKSLADSAKAKKKVCKPKAKAKPKAKGGFKLADGVYSDGKSSVQLTVGGGGTTAKLSLPFSCFIYASESVPLKISGNTAQASENRDVLIAGEPGHVSWSLTVDSTLGYRLNAAWDIGNGICKGEKGTTGKLVAGAAGAKAAAKKKAGKKKAGKCKAKKKAKGKAKGKGKARKSLAADSAAKGKAKGKGKKAKRKCGKAKPKAQPKSGPERRLDRKRNPYEQKLLEKFRERREQQQQRQNRPPPPTVKDMVPADGTYTASAAPGLTVTISNGGTQARVTYTLAKTAFSGATCQTKDVAVDVTGELSASQSTGKGYVSAILSAPNGDSSSATGSFAKDGSFTLGISASYEEPPGAGSFCSGNTQLTGVLGQ